MLIIFKQIYVTLAGISESNGDESETPYFLKVLNWNLTNGCNHSLTKAKFNFEGMGLKHNAFKKFVILLCTMNYNEKIGFSRYAWAGVDEKWLGGWFYILSTLFWLFYAKARVYFCNHMVSSNYFYSIIIIYLHSYVVS